MQLIIYRIFMKLLDKNFFAPPPQRKRSMISFRVNNAIFLDFIWGNDERRVKKQQVVGGGVEETMKGQIVNYIWKCYLKWTPNTNAAWVTWPKIFGIELHFIHFRSCERSELWDDTTCPNKHMSPFFPLKKNLKDSRKHLWLILINMRRSK